MSSTNYLTLISRKLLKAQSISYLSSRRRVGSYATRSTDRLIRSLLILRKGCFFGWLMILVNSVVSILFRAGLPCSIGAIPVPLKNFTKCWWHWCILLHPRLKYNIDTWTSAVLSSICWFTKSVKLIQISRQVFQPASKQNWPSRRQNFWFLNVFGWKTFPAVGPSSN